MPDRAARRARAGVGALFFTNGALFANLVPRYPDLKAQLGLSNAAFGSAIAAYGLGALVLGLGAGALVARYGSARTAVVGAVLVAADLVLIGAAPSWGLLVAVLLVAGALDAIADVATNAHALRVERRYSRSILNSLHAVWSIGAVTGAAMGSLAAQLDVALVWHLGVVAVIFAVVALAAARLLLPGPDAVERPVSEHAVARALRGHAALARTLLVLGTVAAMGQLVEDAGATWGAVYLRGELGASAALGGAAFIALQGAQTIGRLLGDRAVTRFGDRAVARAGALLGGSAMAAALAAPSPAGTIVAFGVVGLGIGTLIPASMRAADALPGLRPGVGLTVVGTVIRLSLLLSPPIVGVVADAASLRVGLLVVPLAAVVVLVLASALPRAGRRPGRG